MKPDNIAKEITGKLRELGPGSRQEGRPSAEKDFGVYVPDLRKVVKEYQSLLKGESGEHIYEVALALLGQRIYECRQVAYELIGSHKEARESLTTKRIETLGQGIDNWASVDAFCCTLVGRAWREGRISDAAILRWSRSKDLWWRRAAVVATVPLNLKAHGGKGDPARTIQLCELLVEDPEEMVQKAISWALRSLVPWDPDAVETFLDTHEDSVSARVRREVTRKLTTGKKN